MIKTAVIGHPVGHSKSPLIHQYWMEKHGIKGCYDAVDIAPDALDEGIAELKGLGYGGLNVTLPHKQAVIPLCDEVDAGARAIGAVNTIHIKDGRLCGANTDAYGFVRNITDGRPEGFLRGRRVFMLGAGGATRACVYGLIQHGVSAITISNRTMERADEIKHMAPDKITICPWGEWKSALSQTDILVNTTSLGMVDAPLLEMDISPLPSSALVCDIVYAPLMTGLLKQARTRGNPVVTGIGMLLHQAAQAFAMWHGVMPDVTAELEKMTLDSGAKR